MLSPQCGEKNFILSMFGTSRDFVFIIVLPSSVSGLRRVEAAEGVRNDANSLPRSFSSMPIELSPKVSKVGERVPVQDGDMGRP